MHLPSMRTRDMYIIYIYMCDRYIYTYTYILHVSTHAFVCSPAAAVAAQKPLQSAMVDKGRMHGRGQVGESSPPSLFLLLFVSVREGCVCTRVYIHMHTNHAALCAPCHTWLRSHGHAGMRQSLRAAALQSLWAAKHVAEPTGRHWW